MKTKELKIASLIFYFLGISLSAVALFMLLGACSKIDLETIKTYLEWIGDGMNPVRESQFVEAMNLGETLSLIVPSIWLFFGSLACHVASKAFEVIYDNIERNSH